MEAVGLPQVEHYPVLYDENMSPKAEDLSIS